MRDCSILTEPLKLVRIKVSNIPPYNVKPNVVLAFPKQKIKMRGCPNCGFIMTQFEIEKAYLNYDCPKCYKAKISEFEIYG